MDVPPPPPSDPRHAGRALRALLALGVLVVLVRGTRHALGPRPDHDPQPPAAVDLARDPEWRLRLLPGVGRVRARAMVRARDLLPGEADASDLLAQAGVPQGLLASWRTPQTAVRVRLRGRALAATGGGEAAAP